MSLESRVAKVEGQLSQLVTTVTDFVSTSTSWRNDVSNAINRLTENISDRTRPNLGIMASWAAVVIAFIVAVGTPIQMNARRESDRHETALVAMDLKLQREYQLMDQKTAADVANLNAISKERHDTVMHENEKNWDWLKWQTQSDLQELRDRRLKDASIGKFQDTAKTAKP